MSQIYLGDKLIASTEGSDIKYNENTSVKEKIDELNTSINDTINNIIAEDGTPFRFGMNENGEYGYIVTDEAGADTVVPFSGKYKNVIVDSLVNTNKGLTYESTWDEIAQVINELFPDQLNLLSVWGASEIYKTPQWWDEPITWYSQDFDITNFSTLTRTVTSGTTAGVSDQSYGAHTCQLITDQKTVSILGSGSVDVSGYTGMARIKIYVAGAKPWSSSDSTSRGWVKIQSLILYA